MIIGYAIPAVQKFQGAAYKSLYYQALEISKADGATPDDNPCLIARGDELYRAGVGAVPSVLIVPQFVKPGAVYTQIPTPTLEGGDFDQFTVTRATTATRVNASGLIESVASGVLRLDYPITGGCPAALIEPSGTNLVLQSAFATGWSLGGGATVSANTSGTLSPENLNTAARLNVVTTSFSSTFRTFTSVSGTVYTTSVFAKKDTKDWIYFVNLAGSAARVWFNIASGTIGTVGAGISNVAIQNYGNGWYRCSWTETAGLTTSYFQVGASDSDNTSLPTSSGSVYIWGAQLETGAIPTSYIPTTTGQATRAADVCSVSGVSGYIGQTQGTIYVEAFIPKISSIFVVGISNGLATSEAVYLQIQPNFSLELLIRSGGSTVNINIAAANWTAGLNKVAFTYGSGSCSLVLNGGSPVTGTVTNVPTCNRITLGSRTDNLGTQSLTDRIRAAAIYTTRLSNDQLASLTRLT